MDINLVSAATSASSSSSSSSSTTSTSTLGKDDFLKILVAELQNQDPTQSSGDSTEYISQLAQFSSLEQMQQLTSAFSMSQAYSLIGKSVSAEVTGTDGTTSTVSGTVRGVVSVSGTAYLNVDGNYVSMDNPISVNGSGNDELVLQGASMIGKTVTGTYTDSDSATKTITGTVDRMAVDNGTIMLYIGSQAVELGNVTAVGTAATSSTSST
jgi:flagellar hook assembly protein FlgD